jgi:hypothetical protein
VENQCYRLKPGDLIILTPEEMHRSYNLDAPIFWTGGWR